MICFLLAIIGFLILYIFWDINYFLRFIFTIIYIRAFPKRVKISEPTSITAICTSQDVDIFFSHMNNARYLREMDFARYHYHGLTGLYEAFRKYGGGIVQGATIIRYRRAIPIFSKYRVDTQMIWWDEKAIYLEQKFVTTSDNFVRAIAISKQSITNQVNVVDIIKEFPGGEKRPEMSEELKLWIESMEASSKKLRSDKDT